MNTSLPITIGVSGHRLIRKTDHDTIKQQIETELNVIKRRCPDSPLVLLDSLACGADSFCAEIALKCGFELVAVLPFEQAEYEKDFSAEELSQFRHYLSQAKQVIILNRYEELESRDKGYLDAGLYIAAHCHMMIAIWDGAQGKPGGCGTAEVVEQIRGGLDPHYITPTPYVSVFHINAVRQNGEGTSGTTRLFERQPGITVELMENTNDFNRDVEKHYQKGYALLDDQQLASCPDNVRLFHTLYMQADSLSVYYRDRYLRTMRFSSVFGVLIILSLLFYNQMDNTRFLVLYALLPIISSLVVKFAKKEKYHQKYIDYRVLAEGARVQIFLLLAGIGTSASYAYPWAVQEENDWIIKGMRILLKDDEAAPYDNETVYNMIRDQLDYHTEALKKDESHNLGTVRASKYVAFMTYVNYIMVFISEVFPMDWTNTVITELWGYPITYKNLLKISLGIISAIIALQNNYYGRLSLPRKIEDHRKYIAFYQEMLAHNRYLHKDTLWQCAVEELQENSSWRSYVKNNSPKVILK